MKMPSIRIPEDEVFDIAFDLGIDTDDVSVDIIRDRLEERLRPSGGGRIQIPRTEKLIVKNVGVFKEEREFEFSDGINLIVGQCGTGNTTLIRCLRAVYGENTALTKNMEATDDGLIKVIPDLGMIERKIEDGTDTFFRDDKLTEGIKQIMDQTQEFDKISVAQKTVRELVYRSLATEETECLLGDDLLSYFDETTLELVFEFLEKQNFQMILTYRPADEVPYPRECNVIKLDEVSR